LYDKGIIARAEYENTVLIIPMPQQALSGEKKPTQPVANKKK
jgi:hypothetical protein